MCQACGTTTTPAAAAAAATTTTKGDSMQGSLISEVLNSQVLTFSEKSGLHRVTSL